MTKDAIAELCNNFLIQQQLNGYYCRHITDLDPGGLCNVEHPDFPPHYLAYFYPIDCNTDETEDWICLEINAITNNVSFPKRM